MKYITRYCCLALSVLLAFSLTGCGTVAVATVEPEVAALTAAADAYLPRSADGASREETVYVVTDASGNPETVTSSVWLKNPEGLDILTDYADLENIQNLKGDEAFTLGEDGLVTWDAAGNEIYYQGTSSAELPVTTAITYELDGKSVTPEELAGAAGHLIITFTYTNNLSKTETVNGKSVTLYQPFLAVSGLMLDNDNAANVTVSGGKTINTGDQTVVVGLAFPGLSDSLGLDDMKTTDGEPVDIDLPDTVTVEADVYDFSLMTALTVLDNSVFREYDFDDIDTVDELTDAMTELSDASTKLVDGTAELYDGVSELYDGAGTLSDGIDEVNSGAGSLSSGIGTLQSGVSDLSEGVDSLAGGASALDNGASQVNNGLISLQSQIADLPTQTQSLYTGAVALKDTLKTGEGVTLYAGAAAIGQGAKSDDAANPGIYEAASGIMTGAQTLSAGLVSGDSANPGIYEAAYAVKSGIDAIPGEISGAVSSASGYLTDAAGQLSALLSAENLTEDQVLALQAALGDISSVGTAMSAVSVDVSSADYALDSIMTGAQTAAAALVSNDSTAPGLYEAAYGIMTGAQAIADGAAQITTGIDEMVSGNDGSNLDAMITGLDALHTGSQTMVDGVAALQTGAQGLADGTSGLVSGVSSLQSGTNSLSTGVSTLATGAATLKSGTQQLADGGSDLESGVSELLSGAEELKDGMSTFDEEGISELSELVEEDAQELMARLRALQDYSLEYTSFSGHCDADGSVRFLLRTDAIG